MIALLGGLLAYGMTYLVDNYYRKSKLVSDAYRAIGNQEGGSAVNIGSELISGWPDDSVGYSIRGTGWFLNKQYVKAATDFGAARERIAADPRCNREWRNASASLVAALAASNDFASALPISDEIMHCAPEKGMVFNHAKLLIFSDRRKEAISLLQSPQLNDESRPDVRGTVSFELGIAHLLNGAIEESVCHFAKAAEFNQGFEFMVTALATRTVDPQGDLVQDFSLEVATIRDHLSSQFIEAWNSRNEDHRSCRSD